MIRLALIFGGVDGPAEEIDPKFRSWIIDPPILVRRGDDGEGEDSRES